MVDVMVEAFREMQRRLAGTLEDYETPEFKELDGQIAHVFDAIYQHEPQTVEEARTMAGFFLDLIGDNDAGDNIHLIEKVRTIVDDCASRCDLAMEIAHGAGI
ncbi:hypothetical protein D0Y60_03790 [Shinella sp. WSJ-2]|uniref:hypothetical protein n=1 Tax=Shinella sp. WSJ-2 TaxID=2303749 RepID=UPI000E3BB16C|nr:hypothetical protein [Shinella sp. WSJ-2]MBO9630916.1 hypothetical protein [Shinella sp.]RFZ89743.1 hypothetical protein D0Y60_03790 [Shinella sp. WSJ-2]